MLKLQWYRDNDILPEEEESGPNGILVRTDEIDGIHTGQITPPITKIKDSARGGREAELTTSAFRGRLLGSGQAAIGQTLTLAASFGRGS